MENGQCDCRRHLIGRQCSEVQPGFFCAPLDYYKYEAEDAAGHSPGDSALPVSTRLSMIQCSSLIHISAQTDDKSPAKECKLLRHCGVVATRPWGEGEMSRSV